MTNITFTWILGFSNVYTLRNVNSIVMQHNLYTIMIIIGKNSDKKRKQWICLKVLSGGLRQLPTTESPWSKNAFYFIIKALFVFKTFTFSSWLFVQTGKPLDKQPKVNFRIYDVTDWTANKYHIHIAWYLNM